MLSRRTHTILDFIVILLYCSMIFLISSIPRFKMPVYPFEGFDKLEHLICYAGLGLVICRFLFNDLRRSAPSAMIIAATLTMLYGLSDEIHQSFIPGRLVSAGDFIFNAAGGVLAVLFWYFMMRPRREAALLLLAQSQKETREDDIQV